MDTYTSIKNADIHEAVLKLKHLNYWLSLNIQNISLPEFKQIRHEIEQLEITIELLKLEIS